MPFQVSEYLRELDRLIFVISHEIVAQIRQMRIDKASLFRRNTEIITQSGTKEENCVKLLELSKQQILLYRQEAEESNVQKEHALQQHARLSLELELAQKSLRPLQRELSQLHRRRAFKYEDRPDDLSQLSQRSHVNSARSPVPSILESRTLISSTPDDQSSQYDEISISSRSRIKRKKKQLRPNTCGPRLQMRWRNERTEYLPEMTSASEKHHSQGHEGYKKPYSNRSAQRSQKERKRLDMNATSPISFSPSPKAQDQDSSLLCNQPGNKTGKPIFVSSSKKWNPIRPSTNKPAKVNQKGIKGILHSGELREYERRLGLV